MKKQISTFIVLLLMVASAVTVDAQQSDYEIQQQFRADYSEIVSQINTATSSDDLQQVNSRITEFVSEYSDHTSVINSAIYPETANERMNTLRMRFDAAQERITSIEELNQELAQLNQEMEDFRGQLAERDQQAEALQAEIRDSQASERRLSELAQQYRQSLQERDSFVTGFIEELLKQYESVDASTAGELADAAQQLDENPTDLIQTILSEYVNYTNQETGLTAPDYLSMRAQQAYFSNWWDNIGQRLTEVFNPDSPVQSEQEVSDLLATWNSAIDNRLWGSISDAFAQNDIQLDNFTSAGTFHGALENYVTTAVDRARDQNREEDLEMYRNFSEFWNGTVKSDWGSYLTIGNVLTYPQISEIDRQMDDWSEASVPVSNLMLILFLVSVAVIIGLVVALVRKK